MKTYKSFKLFSKVFVYIVWKKFEVGKNFIGWKVFTYTYLKNI